MIISISICASRGKGATPIVVQAGYDAENCCIYTSFIAVKLSNFVTLNLLNRGHDMN